MALIRYPGSKAKLARAIVRRFPWHVDLSLWAAVGSPMEYREPFFGAGAIGFRVLRDLPAKCRVWLNDIDRGVAALWQTVQSRPDELHALIDGFTPSVEAWDDFKARDGIGDDDVDLGFRKLVIHQLSYSGLGVRAGGPLGGRDQRSNYPVDCRWKPARLHRDIERHHQFLRRFKDCRITSLDFAGVIAGAPATAFVYCDPPYYEKGPELYRYSMDDAAHARLATTLLETAARWCLSYDDHPTVRALYADCPTTELHVTYTTATAKTATRPKNHELLISAPDVARLGRVA